MDFASGIEREWFARPFGREGWDGIHGIGHTVRVRTHADAIARGLGLDERERAAIDAAAIWHDIGRTLDGSDYFHSVLSYGRGWVISTRARGADGFSASAGSACTTTSAIPAAIRMACSQA